MPDRLAMPPLYFLLDASEKSLQELELASLNRAANLSRATREELNAWVEQSAMSLLARWMIENRAELLKSASLTDRKGFDDLLNEGIKKVG